MVKPPRLAFEAGSKFDLDHPEMWTTSAVISVSVFFCQKTRHFTRYIKMITHDSMENSTDFDFMGIETYYINHIKPMKCAEFVQSLVRIP